MKTQANDTRDEGKQKHTATLELPVTRRIPYTAEGDGIILDKNGIGIARVFGVSHGQFAGINTAFIVKAVNSHEVLVDYVKWLLNGHFTDPNAVEIAKKVLKQAEGE